MAKAVKRRAYDSPRRREQAAETRRRILDAAERLFERDGYHATSIASIAAEAGVSAKTVYLAFETKAGLLRALWNTRLRGDPGDAPVGERDWFKAVLDEPNAESALRLLASTAGRVRQRIGPTLRVIRDAAPADPEIGALWERMQSEFHDNQRTVVEALARRGALRPGLEADRAADILWTVNNPTVYLLLVDGRGWAPEEYESWLAETAIAQLLAR
jgi:AcrR family transcriptional regulator